MKTKTLPINPTCLPDYISLENIPGTAFSEREREKKKSPLLQKTLDSELSAVQIVFS